MIGRVMAFVAVLIGLSSIALAHDPSHHPQLAGWAEEQLLTPEAGQRFACREMSRDNNSCFCCHGSEIVKSHFRLVEAGDHPQDGWEWLNPDTRRWERIENDIIHWDEPTPTGEAVLFRLAGKNRCFYPPNGSGG